MAGFSSGRPRVYMDWKRLGRPAWLKVVFTDIKICSYNYILSINIP